MKYDPFGEKNFDSLKADDLMVLKKVSEGWYVEYKREMPKSDSIAKSISALANTYGGWLFYGIDEKSKSEAVAGSFPGIETKELEIGLSRIRNAAAQLISPSPHYDVRVIDGPSEELGLMEGRSVIVLRIPQSVNTPHVHRTGVVYRRVGDASEPVAETDRIQLEHLVGRRKALERRYAKLLRSHIDIPRDQAKHPYLRIVLVGDVWQDRQPWLDIDLSVVREAMASMAGSVATLPFDAVHTTATGYLARQLKGNRPDQVGLMWQLERDLQSDIHVPLNYFSVDKAEELQTHLQGFDHVNRFVNVLHASGVDAVRVIDLNFLFMTLLGVVNIQEKLAELAGWKGSYWFKAQLVNVAGTVPFLDVSSIMRDFEVNNIPIGFRNKIEIFVGHRPESFIEIEHGDNSLVGDVRVSLKAITMFTNIVRSLGLPEWFSGGGDKSDDAGNYYMALHAAGMRAINVQANRKTKVV